ncbi:MAG TPA: dTDP-4-dehydrorhamnose reductase [Bryobacteraceae bacterium]|nr:dTDP-4-dehydrorhamnose reductase [Bryobacteraceae bacterium]
MDKAESERDLAFAINQRGAGKVAAAAESLGLPVIQLSTDYVFDGTAGRAYTEQDEPHPLGAYAVSKLAGEFYARAYLERPLIVRTCGVFGPGGLKTARGNFVETMLRLAATEKPIRVVEDHVASPTYSPLLAARTADLVERGQHGIFHVGGGAPISWFDFAATIFRVAGVKPELQPTNEKEYRTPARRPKYSVLSNAKMESCGVAPMPPIEKAVEMYMQARASYFDKK